MTPSSTWVETTAKTRENKTINKNQNYPQNYNHRHSPAENEITLSHTQNIDCKISMRINGWEI